jgi:hypothetical protein
MQRGFKQALMSVGGQGAAAGLRAASLLLAELRLSCP